MSATNNPLVSIIMPVYNGEAFLKAAIESILTQTYPNWELLIINDGSTDNSERVIRSFRDNRLRYFVQPNKGVSAARNLGLENMLGEYFCFLDADDQLPPNSLTSRLCVFESDEQIEFVDGQVHIYDGKTSTLKRTYHPNFFGNPLQELLQLSGKCFMGISWMIKRVTNKKYLFNEDITHSEDLQFYIDISTSGKFAYTNEVVYLHSQYYATAMANLSGLEDGYFAVADRLKVLPDISGSQVKYFIKKIKSILVKSYFRKGLFLSGIKVLFR